MSPTPFVSVRKWIKWEGELAGEDTDTLVLTTAAKYFVDIRIYLPTTTTSQSKPSCTILPLSRLEWAFAGTASSSPAQHDDKTGELKKPAHTQWTHWIDNNTTEEVMDEGDMYPKDDGSNEVLEKGAMVKPATGKITKYEECWVDLEPVMLPGEGDHQSWVMITKKTTPEASVKGMMIRIGGYVQAVLRDGEKVGVRKWKWEAGEWKETVIIGELDSPLAGGEMRREMEVGEEFVSPGGRMWRCVESFRWN